MLKASMKCERTLLRTILIKKKKYTHKRTQTKNANNAFFCFFFLVIYYELPHMGILLNICRKCLHMHPQTNGVKIFNFKLHGDFDICEVCIMLQQVRTK